MQNMLRPRWPQQQIPLVLTTRNGSRMSLSNNSNCYSVRSRVLLCEALQHFSRFKTLMTPALVPKRHTPLSMWSHRSRPHCRLQQGRAASRSHLEVLAWVWPLHHHMQPVPLALSAQAPVLAIYFNQCRQRWLI